MERATTELVRTMTPTCTAPLKGSVSVDRTWDLTVGRLFHTTVTIIGTVKTIMKSLSRVRLISVSSLSQLIMEVS